MGQVLVGRGDGWADDRMRSDGDEVAGGAAALEHSTSLPFRGSAPHAVIDAIVEGVVQAFAHHRTGGANALCHLNTNPIAGKEGGGGWSLQLPSFIQGWGFPCAGPYGWGVKEGVRRTLGFV